MSDLFDYIVFEELHKSSGYSSGGNGEERKSGRMEEWKDGRVEEWKCGRMEERKDGRMEGWPSADAESENNCWDELDYLNEREKAD